MKLITRDTDYALRAICFIAKAKDKVVPVSALVKALKIPRPFLRKILQALNKKGILRSYKGSGGGFALGVEPERLFLTDVAEVFQGAIKLNACLFKKKQCPNIGSCILNKKIAAIEKRVIRELEPLTIASLLN